MATPVSNVQSNNPQMNYSNNSSNATNVVSKEYYVKVPNRTKKRYHALKFHTSQVDMASWTKAEMARDLTNQQAQRLEAESLSKQGPGDSKDQSKRRRPFIHMPKKISPEDQPWVLTNKSVDKFHKQYIGKKSVSENSSYFVFIKCADGGFEAWPLEDWYSFAPHKTYKTLNHEEAEEEYKRRNKVLNKYTIMANKRKTENNGGDEDEEFEGLSSALKGPLSSFGSKSKDSWVSDEEDDKKRKKKNYKSTNLSDDDEDKEENEDDEPTPKSYKSSKKKPKRKDMGSDDEIKAKEDSDDGDHEGIEKDYSSSDSSLDSEPETSKFEEKYQQKGIDEEEAIKAQNKSDESESEDDEGLTEEGKAYKKKLLAKDDDENESEETDELFKGKSGKDDDSKDSSSTFDDSDLESDFAKQKKNKLAQNAENKLKRKASDEQLQSKSKKKQNKSSAVINHDDSSSSSSTSAPNLNKSSKTAAVIAAAAANANKSNSASANSSTTTTSATAATSSSKQASSNTKDTSSTGLSEEEVKRYLSRKPMSSKELLQKFKSKTQSTMTNEQIVQSLRAILDKLKPKMIEQNGVKYLSLP